MLLHVFGHVHANHGVLVAEHHLCQCAAEFGFADAGRPEKEEGTERPFRVFQPHSAAANCFGHGVHSLRLSDDAFFQDFVEVQQLFAFFAFHLPHGDTRPCRHDVCDVVCRDDKGAVAVVFFPGGACTAQLIAQSLFFVAQARRLLKVLRLDGFFLAAADGVGFRFQRLQIRRGSIVRDAQARRCLVHEVDGFVRQIAVVDIPCGQPNRRLQRLVRDFQFVVRLIFVAQSVQNADGVLGGGFADHDRLKTAFQRGVFFDILAIFRDGRRADQLHFTAGERRL